ncbi:DoxX family membrane protein [Arthrobacter sp. CAN_C5]|uniref:DoxX family protein n=1 Tax=Arthrobacter sp. CAN_C5 TaxID=2760706 RepID=UPI001AE1BA75|nr:DoxX family membrane protein [Arthrobacter sp. CAN_C5]MBP2217121.1 putative membrane protein [Arthrobacter sp. CAN_C5]
MAPLITLLTVTVLLRTAGAIGIKPLQSLHTSLRGGLVAMFTLTGLAHFNGMRGELVALVPPALPNPALLVTVTGVLELLGAAGLLHRRTAPWAAGGLALLLVAIFPANVYAALAELMVNGAPATALLPRTLIQLVFIAATIAVVLPYARTLIHRRSAPTRAGLPTRNL